MTSIRPPSTLNDPGIGTDPTRRQSLDEPLADASRTETHHPLIEAGQQVGESAGQIASRAKEIGFQQADRGRELTADGLGKLAQTIHRISGEMEEQPGIANLATTVAEQTDRAANYLRTTDARQIVTNVEDLARRSPALFLAGAFVLGAVASRFVKAAGGADSASGTDRRLTHVTRESGGFSATGPGSARTSPFRSGGA
jgi:hypothetical protein